MITCPSGFIIRGDFSNDKKGKDSESLKNLDLCRYSAFWGRAGQIRICGDDTGE
jgi:hypothetical protein